MKRTREFQLPPLQEIPAVSRRGVRAIMVYAFLAIISCGMSREANQDARKSIPRPRAVIGLARIEPQGRLVTLAPQQQGTVEAIFFSAGDHVNRGDTILALDSRVELQNYLQARSRYQAQSGQVVADRAKYRSALAVAKNKGTTYKRIFNLHSRSAATGQELDDARMQNSQARQQVQETGGYLRSARNQQVQLRAELEAAQAAYGRRFILAPSTGILLSIDVSPGDIAGPADPVGTFGRIGAPIAVTEIDELFQGLVCTGQHAYIRNRGMNDTIAFGCVTFAAPFLRRKSLFSDQVGDMEDRRVREVRIELAPVRNLVIGSRVEAVIIIDGSGRSGA